MKDGWVQQVGEPLEIYGRRANKFVAGFIGSPAMNFLPSRSARPTAALPRDQRPAARGAARDRAALQAYKGQPVTLGIRPEDLRVASGADPPDLAFDAVVEVVEPLGSEILLDVKRGRRHRRWRRVEPSVKAKLHETIKLAVNASVSPPCGPVFFFFFFFFFFFGLVVAYCSHSFGGRRCWVGSHGSGRLGPLACRLPR